jgi:hypothetical protein
MNGRLHKIGVHDCQLRPTRDLRYFVVSGDVLLTRKQVGKRKFCMDRCSSRHPTSSIQHISYLLLIKLASIPVALSSFLHLVAIHRHAKSNSTCSWLNVTLDAAATDFQIAQQLHQLHP